MTTLYGFLQLKDLFTERVTTVGQALVADAINQSVAEFNRQVDAMTGLFVRSITDPKLRYRSAALARSQPLDENGRARPIKRAGYYDLAFPIQESGNAWGANYVTQVKMTVEEAHEITQTLLTGDLIWMRDHILAALFTNVSWTFADGQYGDLTIMPLANSDAVTYLQMNGAGAGATDTHFLAQASAIDDSHNPYPTIYTELIEHPENGGQVISLIPTNLVATTEALATFRPVSDPNVRPADTLNVLTGNLGVKVPGDVRGYADKVWIVEWPSLPDSYIVSVTSDGAPPLGKREDPEPELRGFKQVAVREDHPFWESQWLRRVGFGSWNRVGAVVTRIGNASYAVPTNYTSPMS